MAKNAAVDPLTGRTLGRRYELVALIARGGMATVYRAHDRQLDRIVAVKVPRPEFAGDRSFAEQFHREARAAARLSHPNIVTVYDSGSERGLPYIVMEHVTGRTLRELLDVQGKLSPQAMAELLGGVAAALDHAHHAGVVHLDVKPENMLLTAESVKVADFGLVRAARAAPEYDLAGTVQYIAPEVLRGGVVDGRADIYALGVVAYECLTGRPPYDGSRDEVMRLHLDERIPPPSRLVPELPAAVDYAVLVATEPDPERRYRRAADFAAAVGARPRHWSDEAVRATTVISSAVPAAAEANGSRLPTEVRQPPPRRARVPGWNAPPRLRPTSGWQPKGSSRWLQVAAAVLAVLLVVGGVLAWEYVIPRSTTTPNVLDKTFEEAKAELAARGLRIAQGEPIADRRVAAGHVVQQSVVPGRSARRRSVVEVRLSTGAPFVAIPNLQGKSEGAAKQALAKLRLQVQVNRTQHPQVAKGKVISSTPAAPTRIREGSTVTLVVSAGKPLVVVPDVTGQIFQNAQTTLNGAGIAAVQVLEANDQVQPGVVIRTDPPAGTQVERDAKVNVVISAGPVVAVPDVRGMNRKDAIRALADLDLQATIGLDSLFGDEVIEQDPAPGTLVQRGSTVRLRLGRRDDNGDND